MRVTPMLNIKAVTLLLILCLTQQQPVSRFGSIEITDDETDGQKHRLLLNAKEIFQSEGQSIEIVEVLAGRGKDYLIVATNSGGIACPTQFVIVEVYQSGQHKVTEEFGSCSDLTKARVVNDRVIIEMPSYCAHPDLLSKRELRRRDRTKEVSNKPGTTGSWLRS